MKQFVKKKLRSLGLEISRVNINSSSRYFNTGNLNPLEENSIGLYERFYSDKAEIDAYYTGFRLKFYEAVIASIINEDINLNRKKVLDVGCGVGFLLSEVKKKFDPALLVGTDFSEEAIKASINSFPGINFFQHDISMPIFDKYDVIFCSEVLEHLVDPYTAVDNLANALDSGGTLILTVPDGREDTINEHINFWSPESWRGFLEYKFPLAKIKTNMLMNGSYNIAILLFQ